MPVRERRLQRRVAHDSYVEIDTVRYSVPHRLVRDQVEVAVLEAEVRVWHGSELVAVHARCFEPYAVVTDPAHFDGLWHRPATFASQPQVNALATMGRTLADYAAVVGGAA